MKRILFNAGVIGLLVGMLLLSEKAVGAYSPKSLGFGTVSTVGTVGTVGMVGEIDGVLMDGGWQVEPRSTVKTIIPSKDVFPPIKDMKLMTDAIKIKTPAQLCIPFRGSQFGWVGQIKMLSDNKWLPIPTTNLWTPTSEGIILACSKVKTAGVYAFFAYWKPIE